MYIAAGQWQITPGDNILMSTEISCHFGHLLQVSNKSLWSLILYKFFHDFINVYNLGTGADNTLGTKFLCQQEHLVTLVICCKFKKKFFEVWFYTSFFHDFIHVYSPGAGADNPRRQNCDVKRNLLSLRSFATSFKKSLWSLILYNFFHDFIHVYSPGQVLITPWGPNFYANRNILSFWSFVASLKKRVFEVRFDTILSCYYTCI